MKIIVNGEEKETDKPSLNYYEVVELAFGQPSKALQTITFYKRIDRHTTFSGMLSPGDDPIPLLEGINFCCCYTGNA